ncbi:MAG: Gfo/Idh/MocA family oxidoreductase [Thermomicrobiales bacterium]
MIRLGMVGVNTSHADAFAKLFNGDETQESKIPSARVTSLWGTDLGKNDILMKRHRIETLVTDPAEMIGQVDGVLILDDTGGGATHADLARPFIEAGVPTFIDKPMTVDYADAVKLFALAEQHGTLLTSSSALRFPVELEAAKPKLAEIGTISSVISVSPGEWFYYGVHAVELLGTVIGTGAISVHRHSFDKKDVAVIEYESGAIAVVETLRDAVYTFHITAFGDKGWCTIEAKDMPGFYRKQMESVVEMIETKTVPVTAEQTLEVHAILHAGMKSGDTGAKVSLSEIRG